MLAKVREKFKDAGSEWWLSDKAGQVVGVEERDGRFYEDGMEILPEELVGLLPDNLQALTDRLNAEMRTEVLFMVVAGLVWMYVKHGSVASGPLPCGVKVEPDGSVWLEPYPGGCPNCGGRTFVETYQLFTNGDRVVISRVCDHCGREALR